MTEAEIAGYMGWRGPGAYTQHSMRKILKIVAEVQRREREAARCPVDTARVLEWMRTPNRKPAQLAFTEGQERQAAYWIEIAQAEKPQGGEA